MNMIKGNSFQTEQQTTVLACGILLKQER